MSKSVRHFLDISELPPSELRNMLALGADMKAKRKAHDKGGKGRVEHPHVWRERELHPDVLLKMSSSSTKR